MSERDWAYGNTYGIYLEAGWESVLPVPHGAKKWPPKGFTGRTDRLPTMAEYEGWERGPERVGNLILRMSRTLCGIDIDDYSERGGGESLQWIQEEMLGDLPPTWISGSRFNVDPVSGVRLFRVPLDEGLEWPKGEIAPGIEFAQWAHRYVLAWPSKHPLGGTYQWRCPDGSIAKPGEVPHVEDLPLLPESWLELRVPASRAGGAGTGAAYGERRQALMDAVERTKDWDDCDEQAVLDTVEHHIDEGTGGRNTAIHSASVILMRRAMFEDRWSVGSVLDVLWNWTKEHPNERSDNEFSQAELISCLGHGAVTVAEEAEEDELIEQIITSRTRARIKDEFTEPHEPLTSTSPPEEYQTVTGNSGTQAQVTVVTESGEGDKPAGQGAEGTGETELPVSGQFEPEGAGGSLTSTSWLPNGQVNEEAARELVSGVRRGIDEKEWLKGVIGDVKGALRRRQVEEIMLADQSSPGEVASLTLEMLNLDELVPPPHDVLLRTDGKALLSSGKSTPRRHMIVGPMSSGKTWIVGLLMTEALSRGETVALLDWEMTLNDSLARLLQLGTDAEAIVERFKYISCVDMTISRAMSTALGLDPLPDWICIDSVAVSMARSELDENQTNDFGQWLTHGADRAKAAGIPTFIIDHTGHGPQDRARGSSAKGQQVDVSYTFETLEAFSRERAGKARLTCQKDRSSGFAPGESVAIAEFLPGGGVHGELDIVLRAETRMDVAGEAVNHLRIAVELFSEMLASGSHPGRSVFYKEVGKRTGIREREAQEELEFWISDGHVEVEPTPGRRGERIVRVADVEAPWRRSEPDIEDKEEQDGG